MYDLVSVGEVMLRMSPPRYQRLRRTHVLDVYTCGSQLNVAANLARLGKKTAFVTKLPANELGLLALDDCRGYGVDMSHVQMVPGARMGVNYVEFATTPRPEVAVYDRQNSAASTIAPGDFPWERILHGTTLAYTDGIFPGLSRSCRAAALEFVTGAQREGCTVCFDMNYREHLWTPAEAREVWSGLLPRVDILVTNGWVSRNVFNYAGSDEGIAGQYRQEFGCQVVCFTSRESIGTSHGAWNSMAVLDGRVCAGKRVEFDVVDRFGSGDAWFAGFLYGYLSGDVEYALNFGNAFYAFAHTIEGDVVHVSAGEVLAFLEADSNDLRLRR
ncbi:MAG: sugar kinase [Anaerolineae bacterium]|nr:sugar kinase [Anaerolineae bacterium]